MTTAEQGVREALLKATTLRDKLSILDALVDDDDRGKVRVRLSLLNLVELYRRNKVSFGELVDIESALNRYLYQPGLEISSWCVENREYLVKAIMKFKAIREGIQIELVRRGSLSSMSE